MISWCLYVNNNDTSRLAEYLVGLRCNQEAARLFFPGWKLRLYVPQYFLSENGDGVNSEDMEDFAKNRDVVEHVRGLSKQDPPLELIAFRPGQNPMIERYRPFFDDIDNVKACIVRDMDSILSKADADLVNAWLEDDTKDVLWFREYLMQTYPMGGGIGVKTRVMSGRKADMYLKCQDQGRGHDEPVLESVLCHCEENRITKVATRMLDNGVYCLYLGDENATARECPVLWSVPFFENETGRASEYPLFPTEGEHELLSFFAPIKTIVSWCNWFPVKPQHLYPQDYRDEVTHDLDWVR